MMLKVLFWNCRGVENSNTLQKIQHLCHANKPNIFGIAEPMIHIDSIPSIFWRQLGLNFISCNVASSPSLWVFAASHLTHSVKFCSNQQITILCSSHIDSWITLVYGSTSGISRRLLWSELHFIHSQCSINWFLIGDFNACLGSHEKFGRAPPIVSCRDFAVVNNDCQLFILDTTGSFFTWSNGRRGFARVEE